MTTRRTKVDAMIAGMERKVLIRVVTMVADLSNCASGVLLWSECAYLLDQKGFRIFLLRQVLGFSIVSFGSKRFSHLKVFASRRYSRTIRDIQISLPS